MGSILGSPHRILLGYNLGAPLREVEGHWDSSWGHGYGQQPFMGARCNVRTLELAGTILESPLQPRRAQDLPPHQTVYTSSGIPGPKTQPWEKLGLPTGRLVQSQGFPGHAASCPRMQAHSSVHWHQPQDPSGPAARCTRTSPAHQQPSHAT